MDNPDIFSLLIALVVTGISIALVWFFVSAMVSPFIGNFRGQRRKRAFSKKRALLEQTDQHLSNADIDRALRSLEDAFIIASSFYIPPLMPKISSHQLDIFAKLLILAEEKGIQLQALPVVEELVADRLQLFRNYHEAIRTYREQKAERRQKGDSLPSWAVSEYRKKVGDILASIDSNERGLRQQIGLLFEQLRGPSKQDEIIYH